MKEQTSHSIRKNTIISLLISGIGYLYPVLVFVYIARILHPEGLGQATFASSVVSYFALFTGLGMPIYGLRAASACSHSHKELSKLAAELLLIRLFAGLIAWCVFLIARRWLGENELLFIYGFSILAAIPECVWLYKGLEDYSSLAWISVLAKLAGMAALFLLVKEETGIALYAWISVLVPFITSLAELILADRKWNLQILSRIKEILIGNLLSSIRKHIKPLLLFLLMSCAVTIYTHTDAVMLGIMKDERTVGLYSCAAKVKGILPILTGTLWAAALPKSAELWKEKKTREFLILSEKSFHVVYTVTLPLVVYFCLFTEPWILLIGGADYLEAAWTMRLLLLAVIPIGFSNIIGGQMLIPTGNEKKLFQAEATGAAGNILLNALLIPVLSAPGAAIATTISEILVTVLTARSTNRLVKVQFFQKQQLFNSLLGCVVAGIISSALISIIPTSWKVPVSIATFGLLFCLFMIISHDSLYQELIKSIKKILPNWLKRFLVKTLRLCRIVRYKSEAQMNPKRFNLFCPCCNMKLKMFIEGGYKEHPERFNSSRYENTQQDVICPICGSLPRHRILASWCEDNKELFQGSILYFAPEYSMMLWMKRNHIQCTTADLMAKADLQLDIQDTGLPDNSYHLIFCNHVLEHVDDFLKALKEMYRILQPDGHFICSFPMDPKTDIVDEGVISDEERIQRYGQIDHQRIFGMNAEQLLREAGFNIKTISGEDYPEEILPIIGPADYDMNCLFDCSK